MRDIVQWLRDQAELLSFAEHMKPSVDRARLLVIHTRLLESADEIERMRASLTARDTDLMKEVEMYRARWLSCDPPSPAEQAQREEIVPHTPGVMPEGEDVREWTENTSLLSNLCDIALQDAMVDRPGGSYYDDALFVKALAGNGYAIVPLSLVPTQAELAQRKLNDDAWERNKDIREGTDRGME